MSKRITIWIGLDVHAKSIALAQFHGDAATPVTTELPNEAKAIARAFKRLVAEGELRVCYEAGVCGYAVCRQLRKMGIDCVVVAPSLIPVKPGAHVKTDRRDAIKLARLYRAGELTMVWVPSEEMEAVRDLMRAREDVRRDRTSARHRLHKFLLRHGLHFTEGRNWTQRHWRWILAHRFERLGEQLTFEHYVDQLQDLDTRIHRLNTQVLEIAKSEPFRERVERLCTLRGIATLNAMVILTELVDLRRFTSPRQLMSFVGLTPSEHSSGEKHRRGAITKAGNAHVRRALVEASWTYRHGPRMSARQRAAIAEQPPAVASIARAATERLGRRYKKLIGRGKKSQTAVVAVARELCGFIWALEVNAAA